MCTRCGDIGSRELVKLSRPCTHPTAHGDLNIKAYPDGQPPIGFPGWPYKNVHLMEKEIINNIQQKVDQIQKSVMHQFENPSSYDAEDEEDQHDSPP